MNVQLTGHHVEVTPAIRAHLVGKLLNLIGFGPMGGSPSRR